MPLSTITNASTHTAATQKRTLATRILFVDRRVALKLHTHKKKRKKKIQPQKYFDRNKALMINENAFTRRLETDCLRSRQQPLKTIR